MSGFGSPIQSLRGELMAQDDFRSEIAKYAAENYGIAIAAARIEQGECETAYFNCGPETRFEIGSITKVITGALLCEAVALGRCQLDDPVDRWLPQGTRAPSYRGQKITLRHLATQTSGLPRLPLQMMLTSIWAKQPYAKWNRERLLRAISRTRIERTPGSAYAYSNFGFAVLGLALEEILERSYEDLVSGLTVRMNCPDIHLPRADDAAFNVQGHSVKGKPVQAWNLAAFSPAGGCTSTLSGLVGFAQANLEPGETPFLLDALTNQGQYSTRPPLGSGIPRAVLCVIVAGGVTLAFPQSFFIPLLSVEIAAFGAGILGGSLAFLGWEAASALTHASLATMGERVGFAMFAIAMALLTTGRKREQRMGIAWHISGLGDSEMVWHNGETAGFRSFLGLEREQGKVIVVLAAQAKSVDGLGVRLLRNRS